MPKNLDWECDRIGQLLYEYGEKFRGNVFSGCEVVLADAGFAHGSLYSGRALDLLR